MGFFRALLGKGESAIPPTTPAHPLLEHVTAILGPEISAASDFATTLTPALEHASQYFDNQIKLIPGPFHLSVTTRASDPLMRLLFADDSDVRAGFGRSLDVKGSITALAMAGHAQSFALLGMRMRPADQEPGQPPVFADHTIKALGASDGSTRAQLQATAIRRIIKNFNQHLTKLRERRKLLRIEWNVENDNPADDASADDRDFIDVSHLTPAVMVRGLAAWLRRPEETMRVIADDVRVPGVSPDGIHRGYYELPLMRSADRRQWISCIVKFPTSEAVEAVNAETRIHRYIFI